MKTFNFLLLLNILVFLGACSKKDDPEISKTATVTIKIANPSLFSATKKIEYLLTRENCDSIDNTLIVSSIEPLFSPKIELQIGNWILETKALGDSNQIFHYEKATISVIKDKSDTISLAWGNNADMAAYFDGGVNYVNITATNTLNAISDAITMEAWVKPKNQYYNTVISKGQSNFFIEIVEMRPGFYFRNLTINYTGAINYYDRLITNDTIPVNKWTHIACTYSSQDQTIKIYVNGVMVHHCNATGLIGSLTQDLRIGARVSTYYPEYMYGAIDEVRLWNIVRSPSQIRNNMWKKLNGNEDGLVGYWSFSQIINGTTIPDISNHNHTGIITGNVNLVQSYAF